MGHKRSAIVALGIAATMALSSNAFAATYASGSQPWYMTPGQIGPGIVINAPAGYGASWGQAFLAAGGATRTPGRNKVDGSLAGGIGFGNANKYVGVELDVGIISVDPNDGGFGEDGNVALKIHRNLPWNAAIAVGTMNGVRWGSGKNVPNSYYGSYTQVFFANPSSMTNRMPIFATIGYGNGQFQRLNGLTKSNMLGVFGSLAWQFVPRASLIADYTSETLDTGFSVIPFKTVPISLNFGAIDITQRVSNKQAFYASLGYVFNFS
jgi:hypothetical protein